MDCLHLSFLARVSFVCVYAFSCVLKSERFFIHQFQSMSILRCQNAELEAQSKEVTYCSLLNSF